MKLTDPDLFDYPFIYIIEPGSLSFSEEEAVALRRYLLNGGFLMVDDFWGDYELDNFLQQMGGFSPSRSMNPRSFRSSTRSFSASIASRSGPRYPVSPSVGAGRPGDHLGRPRRNTRTVHYAVSRTTRIV